MNTCTSSSVEQDPARHICDPQSCADRLQHRLDQSVLSVDPKEKHK